MQSRQLADGLADLARANERKRDAALLRATTELFVLDVTHDRDDIRRYEELATHFLPKVTTADRTFVAERLSICADAPTMVVRMLARDVIDVAKPILLHAPSLSTIDLLSVIAATGPEHHRLIARRPSLTGEVQRALRLTADDEVIAILGGTRSGLPGESRSVPARGPRPAERIAQGRGDPWEFLRFERPVRLAVIAAVASRPPIEQAQIGNQRLDRAFRSILSAAQIVGFARSGQLAAIVASIAEGLDIAPDLVAAAVNDKSGELLAVMLKALRLDDMQARQVLLLASPSGKDVQSFFPLSDLYAGMEPFVAEALIADWRSAARSGPAHHEPHLTENGERRRSGSAVPQIKAQDKPEIRARRA